MSLMPNAISDSVSSPYFMTGLHVLYVHAWNMYLPWDSNLTLRLCHLFV